MSTNNGNELLRNGIEMINRGAFGAAAFSFFGAVKTNPGQLDAWMNLFVSLQQLDRQVDMQILLGRYAQLGLPFVPPLAAAAASVYRNNPIAMRDWVETTKTNGMPDAESKQLYLQMKKDVETACQQLQEQLTEEQLEEKGLMPLLRIAAYKTPLEIWSEQPDDAVLDRIEEAISTLDYGQALEALQTLAMFPLPRTETILRKCCRDENLSTKMKTHALITLRRAGIQGSIRLVKNGKTWTIDLAEPETPLEDKLPDSFDPVMNWVALWLAKANKIIDEPTFNRLTADLASVNPSAVMESIGEKALPQIVMMSAGFMLKEGYLHYYPDIPFADYQIGEWGFALLDLIKSYTEQADIGWEYGALPNLSNTAVVRRDWILNAIPEMKESIKKQEEDE